MVTVIAVATLAMYSVHESLAWSPVDQMGLNLGLTSEQIAGYLQDTGGKEAMGSFALIISVISVIFAVFMSQLKKTTSAT